MNEAYFVLGFFAVACVAGIALFCIAKNDKP